MTRFAHGCYDKGPELAQLASKSEVLDSVLVIGSNGNMTLSWVSAHSEKEQEWARKTPLAAWRDN